MHIAQPTPYRAAISVAALCILVVACGDGPEDRLATCREAGIVDAAMLERCKQSDSGKEAVIAAFKEKQAQLERTEAARRALEREQDLKRKEQEDMTRRKAECQRLIDEFPSVTPISDDAAIKAAKQFELAIIERDEGYFGKCIDYALYATNLAKGQ